MKLSELKNMIKEAVKEAIQEELKDILLEAVKTPRVSTIAETGPVLETVNKQQPTMTAEQKRAAYQNILGEMGGTMTTNNVTQRFNPAGGDSINGSLPPGEVDMSQIAGLMGKK